MSEVSFISSAPVPATRSPRAAEKSAAPEAATPARENAPPPEVAHKTKVKTEQLSKYTFGYTFLDPETLRVVGQFPAAPPIGGYRK